MGWSTNGLYGRHTMLEGIGHAVEFCVPMDTCCTAESNPQARVVEATWTGCPHYFCHLRIALHTYLQLFLRCRKIMATHLIVHLQVGVHCCIWEQWQYQKLSPQLACLERLRIRHLTYCSQWKGSHRIGQSALCRRWRWRAWTTSSIHGVWILGPPIGLLQNSWSRRWC